MRGEHPSSHVASSPTLGSSPHARGARAGRARQAKQEGIIPACAGSTGVRMKVKHGERDHPRMRGEHAAGAPPGPECWGSSPHARGAQSASHGVAHEQGIIPACAGSTPRRCRARRRRGDHPRMRGEHYAASNASRSLQGSSPHARGARPGEGRQERDVGIIPACAGSTRRTCFRCTANRDHPRMRGEHYIQKEGT